MWKLLAVPFLTAMMAMGLSQAHALPIQKAGVTQDVVSGISNASHKGNPIWRRYPRHHGGYYGRKYYYNRYYSHRRYYPSYRRYYGPYWGWNYCGWGYGYSPYGCFGGSYYGDYLGGYYGGRYYDQDVYPRRERVSNKKHVKWCKARYKTYNPKTDTFVGKGKKQYRCNSPYDGRR